FSQAEDGIRDWSVTGVQTCALPIWGRPAPGGPGDETGGACTQRAQRGNRTAPGADYEGSAPGDPAAGRPGASVRGLILRDDRRGDPAPLADLVAALLGPGPDFRTALTARPAPAAAAAAAG